MSDFNAAKGELVPGGLALTLVDDAALPEMNTVELVRYVPTGGIIANFRAPSPGWICRRDGVNGILAYGEHELLPITPEPDPLQVQTEQEQLV